MAAFLAKRMILGFAAVMLSQPVVALAQQSAAAPNLDSVKFLAGKWVGEGNLETGQAGAGSSSFEAALQGKVLVRKSHSEYPAANGRPSVAHDGLMIIYPDDARQQLRAFYTDNEGHVIHYTVTASNEGKSALFLGDVEMGAPRFRLTYALAQPDHMVITFEMAPPGKPEAFQKIIEGKLRKSAESN